MPSAFDIDISQVYHSILTRRADESVSMSTKKINFAICDELEVVEAAEIKFTINAKKEKRPLKTTSQCQIEITYEYKWLKIPCKETTSFIMNT